MAAFAGTYNSAPIITLINRLEAERDVYRKMAAEKFYETRGGWGIDSSYEITDAEAARILKAKK